MMNELISIKIDKSVLDYIIAKDKEVVPDSVIGFIVKNEIINKTIEEIDLLIASAERLGNGVLKGEGDKFKDWCDRMGRDIPDDVVVMLMNRDPHNARIYVHEVISEHPRLYKAYCSYTAGRGRSRG